MTIESIILYLSSPAVASALSKLLDQFGGTAWHDATPGAKFLLSNVVMALGSYAAYFLTTHITAAQMATYDPVLGTAVTLISLVLGLLFHKVDKSG